nr:unnamed protein product [Callosobruchus analis]
MGCTSLAARAFNQDPVENLFSCIRGYGGCNINPTCTAFVSSLKSLIINNLVSQHSLGSNCEEDQSLKRKIFDYISEKIDFTHVFCLQHKDAFTKQLLDIRINVLVFHYIRRINRILNGKDLRHKDDDILTQKAFQKYSQKVHIRRR